MSPLALSLSLGLSYLHNSSLFNVRTPLPNRPTKKLCFGASGISCGKNSSPIISAKLALKNTIIKTRQKSKIWRGRWQEKFRKWSSCFLLLITVQPVLRGQDIFFFEFLPIYEQTSWINIIWEESKSLWVHVITKNSTKIQVSLIFFTQLYKDFVFIKRNCKYSSLIFQNLGIFMYG